MASKVFGPIVESWHSFTALERRNLAIYIIGIMLYKFGLEAFNGSIVALATNRYDYDALRTNDTPQTFARVGLLAGLNQACQCIGSIFIAPLIKRFPTKLVLSVAVLTFGFFTAILLIVDAATGGTFVPEGWEKDHHGTNFAYYGDYKTDGMIPIYCFTGIAYGMVELIRRVIPRDIVGGNIQKLRRMDAVVHIFYEISGTAGAFCTALVLIPKLGDNFSFIITPVLFAAAALVWYWITDLNFEPPVRLQPLSERPAYIKAVLCGFYYFAESVWTGAKIIFGSRRFIWLLPSYSLALYGHRFLENNVAPAIARRYFGQSAWSQILIGGSNMGELIGALLVFFSTNFVRTPIPWLRLDAIVLLIVWYLPFWYPPMGDVKYAWIAAATFLPISVGWAAGDCSLAAYIQAALSRVESKAQNVSALGAVMSFVYCTYIILYAITSPLLGRYIDFAFAETGGLPGEDKGGDIHFALLNTVGVQFSIIAVVIMVATFIPKGACAWNPKVLFDEVLDCDLEATELDFKLKEVEGVTDANRFGTTCTVGVGDGRRHASIHRAELSN